MIRIITDSTYTGSGFLQLQKFNTSGLVAAYRFFGAANEVVRVGSNHPCLKDLSGNGNHLTVVDAGLWTPQFTSTGKGIIAGNGSGFETGINGLLASTMLVIARPYQAIVDPTVVAGFVFGELDDTTSTAVYGDSIYYNESLPGSSNNSVKRGWHNYKDGSDNFVSINTAIHSTDVYSARNIHKMWGYSLDPVGQDRIGWRPNGGTIEQLANVDYSSTNGISQRKMTEADGTTPWTYKVGFTSAAARNDGNPESRMEILECLLYNRVLLLSEVLEQYNTSKAYWNNDDTHNLDVA